MCIIIVWDPYLSFPLLNRKEGCVRNANRIVMKGRKAIMCLAFWFFAVETLNYHNKIYLGKVNDWEITWEKK